MSLRHDRPAEAQQRAEEALAAGENAARIQPAAFQGEAAAPESSAEARIALGLSFLRQPGQLDAAAQAFQAALQEEPAAYRYQARAWRALVALAQDDPAAALREAQAAVQLQPQSALAHGNLALVHFFHGQSPQAEREGRRAVQLNPDSVAALCALGQALLAQGDVDAAVQMAARAVAMDPSLPQARYLLGVADAQRRDYRHAARELQECLRLAPDFLPAASALARVYTNMGRKQEAVALLTNLLPRHRHTDEVRAALGQVYYQQGQYTAAVEQYREALQQKPNSALYHAELARSLLDENRLNEAIQAGERAVRLAPDVGQYHAVLGLAYHFARLSVQAEREYRTALALDPRNALAHLELGLKAAQSDVREHRFIPKKGSQSPDDLLRQGLQAVGSGPAVSSITQGFLYDPAVSTQLLRGGVDTDFTPSGGNRSQRSLSVTNRTTSGQGSLHSLGLAVRDQDDGLRPNDRTTQTGFSENVTFLSDPRAHLFARISRRNTQQGIPGPESFPNLDDRSKSEETLIQLAMRRRMSAGNYLWAVLSRPTTRFELIDPDQSTFQFMAPDPQGNPFISRTPHQTIRSRNLVPEVRLEWALHRTPEHPAILTLGATRADLKIHSTTVLSFPSDPPVTEPIATRLDGRLSVAYAQWTQRVDDRLSFAAQLRHQRFTSTGTTDAIGEGSQPLEPVAQSYWLPSLLVNYRTDERTLLRLFYNRQAQEQELTTIALWPMETLLTTEPLVLPKGSPDETRTVELDAERYLGSKDFLKLFVFRTTAQNLDLGGLPTLKRVERTGVGLRYERQLSRTLYGQVGFLTNRTTNRTPLTPFDEGTAPYHPPYLAGLALNYIDPSGTKVGLQLNYSGRFFQDTGNLFATARPIFSARTYVDLTLAKEPSVDREYFLKVYNLFDSRAIQFYDFPTGGRRIQAGVTWRY